MPGKGHVVAVSVATTKKKRAIFVDAVYVGGMNILTDDEGPWLDADGNQMFSRISPDELERELSEQMVVPSRLLKLTYTPREARDVDELHIQRGWTVRKT